MNDPVLVDTARHYDDQDRREALDLAAEKLVGEWMLDDDLRFRVASYLEGNDVWARKLIEGSPFELGLLQCYVSGELYKDAVRAVKSGKDVPRWQSDVEKELDTLLGMFQSVLDKHRDHDDYTALVMQGIKVGMDLVRYRKRVVGHG
jgi:hypothetical protein